MVGELHLVVALRNRAEVGGKADRDIVRVHLGHLDHNMITCIHNITLSSLSIAVLHRKLPSPSSFLHHNHHHHHDHLYCHHCNRNELGSCSWFIIWFTPLFLERSARREKRCDTTLGEAIWLLIILNYSMRICRSLSTSSSSFVMEGPAPSSCNDDVTLAVNLRLYENTLSRFCCCCKTSTRWLKTLYIWFKTLYLSTRWLKTLGQLKIGEHQVNVDPWLTSYHCWLGAVQFHLAHYKRS